MAGDATIGSAFIQLVPSASGIGAAIRKELADADLGGSANKIGDNAGKGFLSSFGGAIAGIGKVAAVGVAAAGVGIAAGIGKGITAFADFEAQMNEVFSLIPDAGQAAFDGMTKDVKNFSKEFGVLPEKVVPALYEALSSGVPAGNVFDFLEIAQKAAKGGVTELATTVDGLTSVVNAYGPANITAARASDVMFTAVKFGKTTFEELSQSLFNVNPAAAAVGIRFEEVSAALAQMTAAGVPTSVATTQIRSAIVELTQGAGKASKSFTEISGKSFPEFIKGGGTMQEALNMMRAAADKNGSSLLDMFGSVEGGQAALALTGANAEGFSKALDQMNNSTGATDQAFQQLSKGIQPVFDRIKANIQVFLIDVGEKAAPIVMAALDLIGSGFSKLGDVVQPIFALIATGVNAFIEAFKNPDVTSDGFVGVLEKLGSVARTVFEGVIKNVRAFFATLSTGLTENDVATPFEKVALVIRQVFDVIKGIDFGAVFSGIAEVATPIFNGIKEAVSGFATFAIAAIQNLFKTIQDNKETITTVADVIKNVLATGAQIAGKSFEVLGTVFKTLADNMGLVKAIVIPLTAAFVAYKTVIGTINTVTSAITIATKAWTVVQAALNIVMSLNPIGLVVAAIAALVAGVIYAYTHFEGFRNVVDALWQGLQVAFNWVKTNWPLILAIMTGPVGIAVLLITKHWDTIKDGVMAMVDAVKGFLGNMVNFFQELPGKILSAIGNLGGLLISKGIELIQGFIEGYVNMWKEVISFYISLPGRIFGFIGNVVGTLVSKGVDIIQGLISGATSMLGGIQSVISGIAGSVIGWIGDAASWLVSAGGQVIQGFISGITSWIGSIAGHISGIPSKILTALGNVGDILFDAGVSVISGFIRGIGSMFGSVAGKLGELAGNLTSWKGPKAKDLKLLVPNGTWVIQGFITGLEKMYPAVEDSLAGLATDLASTRLLAASPGLAARPAVGVPALAPAGLSGAPSGSTEINQYFNNANVDADQVAREVSWAMLTRGR